MNQVTLNLLRKRIKDGKRVAVSFPVGTHSSLDGGHGVFYPVCHFSDNANAVWVINPHTDYPCRVNLDTLLQFKVLGKEDEQAGPVNGDSAKFILWNPNSSVPPSQVYDSQGKGEEVASIMAVKYPGEKFYLCRLVAVAEQPKPVATLRSL